MAVHLHLRIGVDAARWHGQVEVDDIAIDPVAGDGEIAFLGLAGHVDRIAIETGHGVRGPVGDAQPEGERPMPVGMDADAHLARERVERFLNDADPTTVKLEIGAVAAIEIDGNGVRADGVEIAAHRGDQARHIHGAAGAGVPGPAAVRTVALELVLVEIEFTVPGESRESAVV